MPKLLEVEPWLKARDEMALIIDARSPHEYAYSHIKNSLNFYALNDSEHQEIGTIYKQNRALAKTKGASYVCANLARHIPAIADKAKIGSLIGIYCARGGMRSASIAAVLAMMGYRVLRLNGGYKAYRTKVLSYLGSAPKCRFITLFGGTGCYKTKLINELSPSLNLEKIANHLGSVFGSIAGAQPSQKAFEDELFERLSELEGELVFVEGESRRIGSLTLPATLYSAMAEGFGVHISANLQRRIECTLSDYKDISDEFFYSCMKKISPFISAKAKEDAIINYEKKNLNAVCEILLKQYYDKVYKAPKKIDLSLDASDFQSAKDALIALHARLSG